MTAPLTPLRRNARFQVLWVGAFASVLGTHMSALAFPLLILAVTGSPATAGLVSAAQLLAMVVCAVPAGVLVDRGDRRRILLGCELVRAGALASVAGAVLTDRIAVPHLVAVALLQGAAAALFNPARSIAVRAVVPAPQLRPALAQEQARSHAAALAGPFLGGLLFGLGRAVPFLVDAVSYLVSLACLVFARIPRRPEPAAPADGGSVPSAGPAAALRWLRGEPFVSAVCLFSLATNLVAGGLMLTFVVLVRDRGGSPAVTGTAMAMAGAGGLLGALLSARIGGLLSPGRMVSGVGWCMALAIPLMALPFGPFWPGVMLATIMLVMPAVEVTAQATLLAKVPDALQGRIMSIIMVSSLGVAPLGPLLAGLLIEAFGPTTTVVLQGSFLALVATGATASPALRNEPAAAPAPAPAG